MVMKHSHVEQFLGFALQRHCKNDRAPRYLSQQSRCPFNAALLLVWIPMPLSVGTLLTPAQIPPTHSGGSFVQCEAWIRRRSRACRCQC
eukprot:5843732-Amphidinium_carterae.1